jgi:hypothetical protein
MSPSSSSLPPSQRALFSQVLPLALSGIFYPLGAPIISAALARTQEPELALAAYSVAFSIAALISSAMWGIRQLTNTFGSDRQMLRLVGRLALILSSIAVGIILLGCVPVISRFVLDGVMGIPPAIGRLVPPALLVMALNPYLSVGRGFYQGVLVRFGRPGPIAVGAAGYLVSVAAVMLWGVLWSDLPGALLAALAMMVGQLVYFVVCWWPCRTIIQARIPAADPGIAPQQRSGNYLLFFYMPLALSIVFTTVTEPILQSGMARAPMSAASLAAYPVCIAILWLGVTPLYNAQQVVIAKVRDRALLPGGASVHLYHDRSVHRPHVFVGDPIPLPVYPRYRRRLKRRREGGGAEQFQAVADRTVGAGFQEPILRHPGGAAPLRADPLGGGPAVERLGGGRSRGRVAQSA